MSRDEVIVKHRDDCPLGTRKFLESLSGDARRTRS